MTTTIEVKVNGRGVVRGESAQHDGAVEARCTLCDAVAETVVSVGSASYACAGCLRERLDAMSVGRWRLRQDEGARLPWGKVSG